MSDVLDDDASIEFITQGLAIGVETNDVQLGLQSDVLSAELEESAIEAELVSDNLILRLYQPGGVPKPDDPFFSGNPGGGELTQEQKDLLVKAAQDAAIAAAHLELEQSAQEIATSVLAQARTLIDSIITATVSEKIATLQTATESIAIKVDTVGSRIDGNVAAIQEESLTRSTKDDAIAVQIDQVVAGNANATAAINETKTAYVNADTAISKRVDAVVADIAGNRALIVDVDQTRADDYQALSNRMSTVEASVSVDVDAKIENIQTAVANNYAATATQIQSVTTTLNGHTTTINQVAQSVNGLYGQWGVTIDVNGYATGFNLMNNGYYSAFNVRVDRFIVAYPGYAGQQPFIIQNVNGVPTLSVAAAVIGDATITNAKITNAAVSTLKIGPNSVTVPAYTQGTGNDFSSGANTLDGPFANLTVSYPDTCAIVAMVSWIAGARDFDTNSRCVVKVDGQTFLDTAISLKKDFTSSGTATSKIDVSAGTHTFSVYFGNNWDGGRALLGQFSMLCLGVMR
jgi:hypothetical protein